MTDGVLVVQFGRLMAASSSIQVALNTLESQLAQLEGDAAGLVASWDGAARAAYDERQQRWRQAADDMKVMLAEIKRAVDDSVVDYQHTEKRATNLFSP
ncbi:WXG100 family type VII secretion target [Solwaraspora sp. WMMD1047]|uniref:WXG100 family type VII secretion target n=1 Tax=Solwaraspora sp. WMMD1047 TaxID=3016102 RepID=UPI002417F68C|nr:WXG100 family type VII secretion target [Solwaraspora sp. WMMD1047]MDG4833885.1 WXG100 family type VII secretion target [Solwaraspora sp. WMMD1047]